MSSEFEKKVRESCTKLKVSISDFEFPAFCNDLSVEDYEFIIPVSESSCLFFFELKPKCRTINTAYGGYYLSFPYVIFCITLNRTAITFMPHSGHYYRSAGVCWFSNKSIRDKGSISLGWLPNIRFESGRICFGPTMVENINHRSCLIDILEDFWNSRFTGDYTTSLFNFGMNINNCYNCESTSVCLKLWEQETRADASFILDPRFYPKTGPSLARYASYYHPDQRLEHHGIQKSHLNFFKPTEVYIAQNRAIVSPLA